MQIRLTKKTDIKIYILYVMKCAGCSLELSRLVDGIVTDGVFSSLVFTECFFELCDVGNIEKHSEAEAETYSLTEQGIHVADNLFDTLLPVVQRTAIACATRITTPDSIKEKTDYTFDKNPDGSYVMHYTVIRDNGKVIAVDMKIENEEQKKRIEYNIENKPDYVYKSIMAVLNGDVNYIIDSKN